MQKKYINCVILESSMEFDANKLEIKNYEIHHHLSICDFYIM